MKPASRAGAASAGARATGSTAGTGVPVGDGGGMGGTAAPGSGRVCSVHPRPDHQRSDPRPSSYQPGGVWPAPVLTGEGYGPVWYPAAEANACRYRFVIKDPECPGQYARSSVSGGAARARGNRLPGRPLGADDYHAHTNDDDLDSHCPQCEVIMLPRVLPTGAVIGRCRNCGTETLCRVAARLASLRDGQRIRPRLRWQRGRGGTTPAKPERPAASVGHGCVSPLASASTQSTAPSGRKNPLPSSSWAHHGSPGIGPPVRAISLTI
ncbi:MAG: hypothetical protein JWQ92_626 [Amnibacterium sp.]|nr:hypothetical protein [Amnibacterium sp.]